MESKKTEISWESILKIGLMVVGLYVLFIVKDILIWFIFALVISILFNPFIDFIQRRKVPRIIAATFVYILFFGSVSLLMYLLVPIFVVEIRQFVQLFPYYFEKVSPSLRGLGFEAFQNFGIFLNNFQEVINSAGSNAFNGLILFFGGISSTLFVITVAFFLSVEEKAMEKFLMVIFPKRYEAYALALFEKSQKKVSGWFVARIIACIFVALVSYIAFALLNVSYPITLAFFVGIFNFVPYVGPLFSGIGLFLLIFPSEMLKGIFVLTAFFLIQMVEGSIISPILMKKIIGLSPALVLVSLALGGVLWGFLGAIMAVPLLGILFEFIKEFMEKKKEREFLKSAPNS